MSLFTRLHEARWKFLSAKNPLEGSCAILAPGYVEELEVERGEKILAATPSMVLGIPFSVSRTLPSDVLAVFYSGRQPFDAAHPERTVVLRKGEA